MQFPAQAALWFLPFVAPLCFIVALTDLREMRIPNWTVDSLAALYVLLGMLVMPSWTEYGWQLLHLPVGLAIGFLIYAAGLVGAGDAKFAGAAAPYVALADLSDVAVIFAFTLLSGFLDIGLPAIPPCAALHRAGRAGMRAASFPWACAWARRLRSIFASRPFTPADRATPAELPNAPDLAHNRPRSSWK